MLKRLAILISLLLSFSCFAAPKVVVTIKPLHALVTKIMHGVGEPVLLLPNDASPHTFALKPSTLKQLQQAQLVMWVGPSLELFMERPLKELKPAYGIITFLKIPTLHLLAQRQGRLWEDHAHEHDHDHTHDYRDETIDPHFWLSVDNAIIVVNYVEQYLSKIDQANQSVYHHNAQQLQKSLKALKASIDKKLQNVHETPFLVYHDGYHYFENEFNLNAAGTFMLNPHLPISAKALNDVKKLIRDKKVKCVFRETEFNDSNIERLLNDAGVTFTELDPLGARIKAGPDAYQEIMLGIASSLQNCLASK